MPKRFSKFACIGNHIKQRLGILSPTIALYRCYCRMAHLSCWSWSSKRENGFDEKIACIHALAAYAMFQAFLPDPRPMTGGIVTPIVQTSCARIQRRVHEPNVVDATSAKCTTKLLLRSDE